MPKVHFFKLAQELGERPVELQKKLTAAGIAVRSTSTTVDEDTAVKIRDFVRQEHAAAGTVAAAAPQPATAPAPATEAPAPTSTPTPAPEPRPVTTHVVKRTPGNDGQPAVQRIETRPAPAEKAPARPERPQERAERPERPERPPRPERPERAPERPQERVPRPEGKVRPDGEAPKHRKVRNNLLITPLTEGGLSPEAEFGIVKAAGTVPLPPPRPARPPRPEGGPSDRGPRPPRPEGDRGPRPQGGRGPMAPMVPQEVPGIGKPGAKPAAGRTTDTKKKQKRTVFSDKDKERPRQVRSGGFSSTTMRGRRKRRTTAREEAAQFVIEEPIIITGPVAVGDIAEMVHVLPAQVITQLIGIGILATVNQVVEPEQAVTVLEKLGFEALYEREMAEQASWRLTTGGNGAVATGTQRPPVVTILGHVDHGKTTLLDSIRKTNVTEQEFGGITQHIGAYQVVIKGQKITFLDTPGHAAFTAMRARGANLTDIAVLVVAADDGIQPQTVEAINHAQAAKVPIIVAINKIDVPDAQPDQVKQQLTAHDLVSEEWGGQTIMVPVSAKKGQNIEQLLEMILLVSEVQELRAEADKPARGAVVESKLDKQRGPVATVLVQEGTMHIGDALVVGMYSGKIRAMNDDRGNPIKEAGPSTPVEIVGLSDVPVAGDLFEVVDNERKAREIAEGRQMKAREERLQTSHMSLTNLSSLVAAGQLRDLNIIVKSDVAGSIEAISQALSQVEQEEIRINIIHGGVGDVTESDILLAQASDAIVIGFHVKLEPQARTIAEESGIDVRLYQIIYDLIDDVQKAMVGMLAPVFEEAVLGHAEVRATFKVSRLGVIAGCYVIDGKIQRGSKIRVRRHNEVVYEGVLDSLKHLKEDVREMAQGFECGISLDNFNNWQEGDVVESYIIKELRRETL